jgi:hypothetical protein
MSEQCQNQEARKERRVNWPQEIDPEFWYRLRAHMEQEEMRERLEEDRMEQIEADLRPLKKMYWAVMGSGAVASLLLMTLLFIYSTDREESKAMRELLYKQGNAIERLLQSQDAFRRDMDRIERNLGAVRG